MTTERDSQPTPDPQPEPFARHRGDIFAVTAEALDGRGQGLAPDPGSGLTIVVPGLFPGERGKIELEALSRHKPIAHAWLRELVSASASRRALPCGRHQDRGRFEPGEREPGRSKPACAGCPLMALDLAGQREAKRAMVAREHGLELDALIGGDELGYRWSSKRAVSGRVGRLVIGSRVARQRQRDWIADMRGCLVDHPRIEAAFAAIEDRGNELGLAPWHEGAGDLRYIWAKTNGEAVIITLITGAADSPAAAELGGWLVAEGHAAGVAHSVQAEANNAIRGEDTRTIAGVEQLELRLPELPGLTLELGPLGFLQPNPRVAALAYRDLVGPGPGAGAVGALALDLYAGAGVTTALLRERFAEVVPCEAYPESAAALGVAPETAEDFCARWQAEARPTPELIIANPPRAGLGERVCAGLRAIAAPRLHIMSCNPATLRADLDRLGPSYTIEAVHGYDTLPQTPHVELVAFLRRRAE